MIVDRRQFIRGDVKPRLPLRVSACSKKHFDGGSVTQCRRPVKRRHVEFAYGIHARTAPKKQLDHIDTTKRHSSKKRHYSPAVVRREGSWILLQNGSRRLRIRGSDRFE